MARDKTRDLRKGTRRNFVKKLSAIGVSAASIKYLSKAALADVTDDPTEQVPVLQFLKVPDSKNERDKFEGFSDPIGRIPVYKPVDRDRWLDTEARHNAARDLQRELQCGEDITGVTVGVKLRTNGQKSEPVLRVAHRTVKKPNQKVDEPDSYRKIREPNISVGDLREKVPSVHDGEAAKDEYQRSLEDIPVIVEQIETVEQSFDKKYRPVSAGCQIETQEGNATLGTPVTDKNGNDQWVTAAHVADIDRGDDTGDYTQVYQPDDYDDEIGWLWGTSSDYWWYPDYNRTDDCGEYDGNFPADAAIVDSHWDSDQKFDVSAEGGGYEDWEIKGTVAWDRIKTAATSWFDPVHYRQGQSSGRDSGSIVCADEYMYVLDIPSLNGDSGGPYFEVHNGDAYIGAIHRGISLHEDGDSEGTAMQAIEDEMDVYVGNEELS